MATATEQKHKYLILGMGPGETSQARAMAKFLSQKGEEIVFAARQKENLRFVENDKEFKTYHTELPPDLAKVMGREKPDVFLLFNSKIWASKGFTKKPPFKKPLLSISIDSNWLFNNEKYRPFFQSNQWVDRYFINLPKKIFELGLAKNGSGFVIPKKNLKKIVPVGFIPSYKRPSEKKLTRQRKKYGLKKDEKFIFSYFSGFGAGHRLFAFNNMQKAVDRLIKEDKKIKVLYVGPTKDLPQKKLKKKWLIVKENLASDEFFNSLAASDLVFQHQGMVTLAQAISAGVPTIANVHLLKRYSHGFLKLHFYEVEPFEKCGACRMFSKSNPIKQIAETIDELLFDKSKIGKMKKAQKEIFEAGEEKSYEIIKNLLKEKEKLCVN